MELPTRFEDDYPEEASAAALLFKMGGVIRGNADKGTLQFDFKKRLPRFAEANLSDPQDDIVSQQKFLVNEGQA